MFALGEGHNIASCATGGVFVFEQEELISIRDSPQLFGDPPAMPLHSLASVSFSSLISLECLENGVPVSMRDDGAD